MKQSKITALYSRLSRDDENIGESGSIQTQKVILEEYAAKNGFINIVHFADDGWTGGNFERPYWKRLIAEIENGNVATVISKDLSREDGSTFKQDFTPRFSLEKKVFGLLLLQTISTAKTNQVVSLRRF
jgi:hypothetical protein